MAASSMAMKTFSLANDIYTVSPQDDMYKYDPEIHKRVLREQPWVKEYAIAQTPFIFRITY